MGDVIAGVPKHRVDGAFPRASGADHITHIGHGVAFFLEGFDGVKSLWITGFQHRQGVQWDVWTRGCVGGWGEVVCVGLAVHLEHGDGDLFGELISPGKPFRCSPAVHDLLGITVAGCQLHDVVKSVVDQKGAT